MTRANVDEVRRLLSRVVDPGDVQPVRGSPDEVKVRADRSSLRAVKSKLMREDYSYQSRRDAGPDWHVFKKSAGGRGPPRNSRELTRSVQSGDFDMFGGGR